MGVSKEERESPNLFVPNQTRHYSGLRQDPSSQSAYLERQPGIKAESGSEAFTVLQLFPLLNFCSNYSVGEDSLECERVILVLMEHPGAPLNFQPSGSRQVRETSLVPWI